MKRRILIISNKYDLCCDLVIFKLRKMGLPYVRLNLEDVTEHNLSIDVGSNTQFQIHGETICFEKDIKSIWYRRPGDVLDTPNTPPEVFLYANNQWINFLRGLTSIEGKIWVNDPLKNSVAESKILQLRLAKKVGFDIPQTLITNSKLDAAKFYEVYGGKIIAKALYSPLIQTASQDYFIFTNRVENIKENFFIGLNQAPVIFQEEIEDKRDIRVTVIDDQVLAASIVLNSSEVDWRKEKGKLQWNSTHLPVQIQKQCIEVIKSFGLLYGAIDLLFSHGKYYFLELNPNGEWGWLDDVLPISKTLACFLAQ